MLIRPATPDDRPRIWAMLEPIARAGEHFALARDCDEATGMLYFCSPERLNFMAEEDGEILGASFVRPNQQGGGAHIANCGYMTAEAARGRGAARALCVHSIDYCRAAGFKAIQFNYVVSSNAPAVHLWHSLGFDVLARLPKAFDHPGLGYVDVLVMWQTL